MYDSYLVLPAVGICKTHDTGLDHLKQQNGPDIIDICYLLSIKKGDGLAVVSFRTLSHRIVIF
jgi:hypothetical protein